MAVRQGQVMAVLNVTPDSFSGVSVALDPQEVVGLALRRLHDGADIIDIGGCSTRPGGSLASEEEERARVMPALRALRENLPDACLSVDTFRSRIAEEAASVYGVQIINDISGGEWDTEMFRTVGAAGAGYVLSFMPQKADRRFDAYAGSDITGGMLAFFRSRIKMLDDAGVRDIIIDPGFGFAKTLQQNYEVLDRLGELNVLGYPVLAGLSRKSMIYKPLGITPQEALNGTTALNMAALLKGASVLRVHDVKEARQTIELYKLITTAQ